jgi:signal recognition particle GTPase
MKLFNTITLNLFKLTIITLIITTPSTSFITPYPIKTSNLQSFKSPTQTPSHTTTSLYNQFSALTDSLTSSFSLLPSNTAKLTPTNISPALQKIREALISSDVNVNVADQLLDRVKDRAIGEKVKGSVTGEQYFTKLFYDELVTLMGGSPTSTDDDEKGLGNDSLEGGSIAYPKKKGEVTVVVMAGLQGAGKTTFTAKLGRYLQEVEVDKEQVEGMGKEELEGTLRTRLPRRMR